MVSVEVTPDGRRSTTAHVGPFEVARLEFPAAYSHGVVDPSRSYAVVVLEGAVRKTFARDTATLARGSFATLPAGAAHSSEFAEHPTKVLAMRHESDLPLLGKRRHLCASAVGTLAWRMCAELDTGDASSKLALEGLALQLLAAIGREDAADESRVRPWLRTVRDVLHERTPEQPTLSELAASVAKHPTHVARAFRREYGQTIGAYARALRLEWAASRLAEDVPLARVAVDAGFADQSHFTRAFRRHTGVTPGRYRARLERD